MRTALRVGGVGVAVLFCAASATAPAKHKVQTTFTHSADFERVWSATIDVFAERKLAIAHMVKDSGIATSDWMTLTSPERFADCGGSGLSSVVWTRVRLYVRVKPGKPTSIAITTAFEEMRSFDGTEKLVQCESKGTLEPMVNQEIGMRVASGPAESPPAEEPPASVARGHFCAASSTTAVCAREKRDCESGRNAAIGAVPDLAECALTETVFCVGEQCMPALDMCQARGNGAECVERK